MNRRQALIAIGGGGAAGGCLIVGGTLYGSSDLTLEPTDEGTVVQLNGEQIDSLSHPVTPVENSDAFLGISLPKRATVQKVALEVVWAIKRDGIWSATMELVSTGDISINFDPVVGTVYRSTWDRSPPEASGSTSSQRRYTYPRGTTAGRVDTVLTAQPDTDLVESPIELELRLSAHSLTGTHIELTEPADLIYSSK